MTALVYYTCFTSSLGGGDILPLLIIDYLQRKGISVTLALNWQSDVENAMKIIGVSADMSRLSIAFVKPRITFLRKIDAILPFYTTWQLKKLAKKSDLCISTANLVDFGKPAHHFVYLLRTFGDNAFVDYVNHGAHGTVRRRFSQKLKTFVAETIIRPILGVRSTRKIIATPREHIYSTSMYVERILRAFYGNFTNTVFYPPTLFTPTEPLAKKDPLRVVYVGQIFPEKRVLDIIDIVSRARAATGKDIRLDIAGSLIDTHYVRKVREIAYTCAWLSLVGYVSGEAKSRFLSSATYAIHGERDETFGISITEYLKSRIIPIVPDEGGACEIVDSKALSYSDNGQASDILSRLLSDETFRDQQLRHCVQRAALFTVQSYTNRQSAVLDKIIEGVPQK